MPPADPAEIQRLVEWLRDHASHPGVSRPIQHREKCHAIIDLLARHGEVGRLRKIIRGLLPYAEKYGQEMADEFDDTPETGRAVAAAIGRIDDVCAEARAALREEDGRG